MPVGLSKPGNLVKNVVKKTGYNELGKKANNISTTDTSSLKILIITQKIVKLKIK